MNRDSDYRNDEWVRHEADGSPTLRVRQDDPFARAKDMGEWKPCFVARSADHVVHTYRLPREEN